MVYPHTHKNSKTLRVDLVQHVKKHKIEHICVLYLANILIQGHVPQNHSQKSTNKLAKEALGNITVPVVKDPAAFRYFKISCDRMLREDIYALLVCVSPMSFDVKINRLHLLCQDILIQTNRQGRYRYKKRRKKR